jgi:hypothetical protein
MKITLEQYGDKFSIETEGDGQTAIEVLDYVCQLMMCAGYHYDSVKQAVFEKAEGYEYEESTDTEVNSNFFSQNISDSDTITL